MSIHFVSGKPGGGKSLYGVKLIVDELICGQREVFTNVPLRLDALNEYLQRRYPHKLVDIARIRILTDEETAFFWTFRPGGVRVGRLSKAQWQAGELPCYSGVKDEGVMYVIDEVHNYFGARQWAQTGQDVLFYLSQHRKMGDTVICITQAVNNVDKQFRSVTQDFTFLRNLSKETYGKFRLPGVFVRKTFTSPPTETSVAMETGTFRLDVSGLASCYSSEAGVGILGRSADKQEVRKGLNMVWAGVLVVVVGVLAVVVVPKAIAKQFSVTDKLPVVAADAFKVSKPLPAPPVAARPGAWVGPVVPKVAGGMAVGGGVPEVWVTAVVRVSSVKVVVGLSDGRQFVWPGEVQSITDRFVVIDGESYRRDRPLSSVGPGSGGGYHSWRDVRPY